MKQYLNYHNQHVSFLDIPELARIVGDDNVQLFDSSSENEGISKCFKALMTSPQEVINEELRNILKRFATLGM